MKTQVYSTNVAAILALVAGFASGSAHAQYVPYGPAAQAATSTYGFPSTAQTYGPTGLGQQQRSPVYAQQPYATRTYGQQSIGATPPTYGRGYTALAQVEQIPSPAKDNQSATAPAKGSAPPAQSGYSPAYPATSASGDDYPQSAGPHSYAAPGSNYVTPGGYTSPACGYSSAGCGYGAYGSSDPGICDYMNCGEDCGGRAQWFLGLHALFMERDDSAQANTSVTIDTNAVPAYPYYPPAMPAAAVLRTNSTDDVDYDWQYGAELRFGSTFGCASLAKCGLGPGGDCSGPGCTYQPFAWEFGVWFIGENENASLVTDTFGPPTDTIRMYSMINYAGLSYNGLPLNDYTGYAVPIGPDGMPPDLANDIVPVAFRTRTTFSARNLELNFLRLPMVGGSSVCGVDCGCGGCGTSSGLTVASVCGVRYLRFDDDFYNDIQFADPAAGGTNYDGFDYASPNEIFHQINVDNHLTGFQLGGMIDYTWGCWSWFCNSQFGIFGNYMTQYQRVHSPGGPVSFVGNGANALVDTKKEDIAFIGELRCGGAYRISQNCRLTASYRAVALSGVALSVDQISPFVNSQGVGRIDSQGSLLLHGLQIGSEFRF